MPDWYDTDATNYEICSFLGQSMTNIATVYIAKHIPSRTLVTLKKCNVEKLTREEIKLVQDEIILMRLLNHRNILPCLASFVTGNEIVSVLPLMGYGSCNDILMRHFPTGIPEAAIACILKAVIHALSYLHSKAIIHRAIRASHILIAADGHVCLSGLRYSCLIVEGGRWQRKVHSFPSTTAPNLNWLSPELLEQNLEGYNEKSDVYSLGVTACELANGIVPYFDTPTTLMLAEKVRGNCPHLIDQTTYICGDEGSGDDECLRVMAERKFTDSFHDLVESCLERDVTHRPTSSQLLTHPFLKSCHNASLPDLIIPAAAFTAFTLPDNKEDLESIMASERLTCLELEPVSWDF